MLKETKKKQNEICCTIYTTWKYKYTKGNTIFQIYKNMQGCEWLRVGCLWGGYENEMGIRAIKEKQMFRK